jgi:CIC family chloride channel protein
MAPKPTISGSDDGHSVFHRSLREFLRNLPARQRRYWAAILLTGTVSGLGAVALVAALRALHDLAWPASTVLTEAVAAASPLHRVVVTFGAGLVLSLVVLVRREPIGGHGVAGALEAIWARGGDFSLRKALLFAPLAIFAVALGAPLGREGALLALGAGCGSFLAHRFSLGTDHARVLVACGTASGLAAAYNVPVGGALFGLEVLLGSFALELLGPIVLSCVVATVVSRVLIAHHPAYVIPAYDLGTPTELLLCAVIGPLLGIASAVYVRVVGQFANLDRWVPPRFAFLLPAVAMGLVGIASIALPELLGNGYDTVNAALLGEIPLALLLLLPFCKLVASAVCSGAGVPGGLFTPSLFYGALIGGLLGELAGRVVPLDAPPGSFALVGMAAVLAGTTHATVTAVLTIFEMTRDYGVILPLMLTCVLATAVSRKLSPDSLYTAVLRRRHIDLPQLPRPRWLQDTPVRALLSPDPATVPPVTPFPTVVMALLALPPGDDLYVTDADGRYRGALILDSLKGAIPDHSILNMVLATDVMDTALAPLSADATLSVAVQRFADTPLERLPVVEPSTGVLIGTLAKRTLLGHKGA